MVTESCLVCSSNSIQHYKTVGAFFRIWRCGQCTFTWVDRSDLDRPDAVASYEDYYHNQWIRENFESTKPFYLKGFKQRIARTLGHRSLQDCSFLDVGCANGEYLWTAKSIGFGVVAGVEIDSTAAKRASTYGEVKDNACKFSESSFDVVQIKNILGNIPDFVPFMAACLKVVKPNGFLLVDVLNQNSLTTQLRNILIRDYQSRYGYIRPPYVVNGFNKASLMELYNRLGLTPTWVSTSYVGSSLVPYDSCTFRGRLIGMTCSLVGKAMYLLTEAKPIHLSPSIVVE